VTYVIAQPCVDLKDKACIEECPVDCIYEGERSLYIHPDECVDCGAGCGMGDVLKEDARAAVQSVPGVSDVDVELVWDPPWGQDRMSDAARLQLGMF